MFLKWVLIHIVSRATGYSEHGIRAKIKKGVWIKGIHWNKAPDERLVFNLKEIEKWMENSRA